MCWLNCSLSWAPGELHSILVSVYMITSSILCLWLFTVHHPMRLGAGDFGGQQLACLTISPLPRVHSVRSLGWVPRSRSAMAHVLMRASSHTASSRPSLLMCTDARLALMQAAHTSLEFAVMTDLHMSIDLHKKPLITWHSSTSVTAERTAQPNRVQDSLFISSLCR